MNKLWESEEIIFDGDIYFEKLLSDIEVAQMSITLEMYMFKDDKTGELITNSLISARKRGVDINVIVDGVGSYDFHNHLQRRLAESGIPVKIFNPLPFYHPFFGTLDLRKKLSALSFRILRINRRNHRKVIIIDKKIIYIGSFNIASEHTQYSAGKKWKDIGARVSGEEAEYASMQFKKIWSLKEYLKEFRNFRRKYPRFRWKEASILLNHSMISKGYYQRDLIKKIRKSKSRIWLTTPYFIPTRQLIRELSHAARRGVEVRLLISSQTDVNLFRTLRSFYYPYLIKNNVRIHEYQSSVLHAKVFIIDDWISLGSRNLNHRSFLHDLEADLSVQKNENKKYILEDFTNSIKNQAEIKNEYLKARPIFDKILARILFLFKYWF
jgi:cardiolipin synthase A/B